VIAERSVSVRAANDRICASAVRLRFEDDQRVPFVCECGDARCLGTVMLTLAVESTTEAITRVRGRPEVSAASAPVAELGGGGGCCCFEGVDHLVVCS
jgi:hypothetical protein